MVPGALAVGPGAKPVFESRLQHVFPVWSYCSEPIENVLPWAPRLQARAFYGYQAAVENIHSGAPHADLNMSPSR